jgi:DNA-directed RNA polymerase subunit K/omega
VIVKRAIFLTGLFCVFWLFPLAAQQREEGVAICYYEENTDSLYATHKTYPFGTKVVVINPVNKARVTVQIGGRPDPVTNAIIEISEQTGEKLGLPPGYPQWVWLEAVPQPAADVKHVMRPRIGMFKQTGNAVTQAGGGSSLTANHSSLPMGTKIKVTSGSRNVTVTIQGRIAASKDRILEISQAAARALGIQSGAKVTIETTDN